MDGEGMTDLQFKGYLRLLMLSLEHIEEKAKNGDLEGTLTEIANLKHDLLSSLQG